MCKVKDKKVIKVAFCVSYDWEMLHNSLPRVYPQADMICLGVDRNRRSWAGKKFDFDEAAFQDFVRGLDTEGKIDVYEDDFALPGLNSRENGNRHRQLMAGRMGKGGWHLQVDADEYFLDFKAFVDRLLEIHPDPSGNEKAVNVCANWIPVIKKVDGGYLYVDFGPRLPETVPIATNRPHYERARHNGHFNILTPCFIVHETWARSDDDLWFKINNWGHAAEELEAHDRRLSYYKLWQSLDRNNFQYIYNFHPATPKTWPGLQFGPGAHMQDFMAQLPTPYFPLSSLGLRIQNSRNAARIRSFIRRLRK